MHVFAASESLRFGNSVAHSEKAITPRQIGSIHSSIGVVMPPMSRFEPMAERHPKRFALDYYRHVHLKAGFFTDDGDLDLWAG